CQVCGAGGGADRPSVRLPPQVSWFNAERYLSLPLLQLARVLVVFVLRNSPYDTLKGPDLFRCCKAHRRSPSPHHLRKRAGSQSPFLRRCYPASTVTRPCPTPVQATA